MGTNAEEGAMSPTVMHADAPAGNGTGNTGTGTGISASGLVGLPLWRRNSHLGHRGCSFDSAVGKFAECADRSIDGSTVIRQGDLQYSQQPWIYQVFVTGGGPGRYDLRRL